MAESMRAAYVMSYPGRYPNLKRGRKMKTNRQTHKTRILSRSTLISVAAIILLGSSQTVLAQQWTGPEANGNISNANSGNVGIGTTSPSQKLSVMKDATGTDPIILELGGLTTPARRLLLGYETTANYGYIQPAEHGVAYRNLAINPNGGNVGIGTTSPIAHLDVRGGAVALTPGGGLDPNVYHTWFPYFDGNNYIRGTTIIADQGGNVGIGTTTPSAKLDVNGSINVSGNINAKFQDVAEWVASSEKLPTGTVVVLDSSKSNQVVASTVSYDTRVAGVISEQPGIALGEKGESKVLVATTGRVRMKVDATRAPIHIGDLLVTSDIPGVAMKSEPLEFAGRKMHMPGTLIGKALEPLEKGSETILVLLSLQ